jgi:hypothetical protein
VNASQVAAAKLLGQGQPTVTKDALGQTVTKLAGRQAREKRRSESGAPLLLLGQI